MILVVVLGVMVPVIEIAVFVQVAEWIGGWPALLLLLAVSLLGVVLLKTQGVAVFRQGRAELAARRIPGRALVDGLLLFAAALALLVPGFVTAVVGLVLLVPLTRRPLRELLVRRWSRSLAGSVAGAGATVVSARSVVVEQRSDPEQLGRQRAVEAGDEPLG
ncbi:MAG: FxsA family protein [Actinomycetota bacterium]